MQLLPPNKSIVLQTRPCFVARYRFKVWNGGTLPSCCCVVSLPSLPNNVPLCWKFSKKRNALDHVLTIRCLGFCLSGVSTVIVSQYSNVPNNVRNAALSGSVRRTRTVARTHACSVNNVWLQWTERHGPRRPSPAISSTNKLPLTLNHGSQLHVLCCASSLFFNLGSAEPQGSGSGHQGSGSGHQGSAETDRNCLGRNS